MPFGFFLLVPHFKISKTCDHFLAFFHLWCGNVFQPHGWSISSTKIVFLPCGWNIHPCGWFFLSTWQEYSLLFKKWSSQAHYSNSQVHVLVTWLLMKHLPYFVWRMHRLLIWIHRRTTISKNQSWNLWSTTICEAQFKFWSSIFGAIWRFVAWV